MTHSRRACDHCHPRPAFRPPNIIPVRLLHASARVNTSSRRVRRRNPIGKAETMTGFVPIMWAAWFVLILLFAAVNLYAAHLAKNEEDQLYLYESSGHIKAEQDAMLARVQRIEPFKRVTLALAGLMTIFVIGYYVLNMIHQFRTL